MWRRGKNGSGKKVAKSKNDVVQMLVMVIRIKVRSSGPHGKFMNESFTKTGLAIRGGGMLSKN